ncbi:MAG: undecaprenyl-phosphate glucose phosphotransferase [Dongiaceae bacterium]
MAVPVARRQPMVLPRRHAFGLLISLSVLMPLFDLTGFALAGWLGYQAAFDQATRTQLGTIDPGIFPGIFTAATTICAALACLTIHAAGGYRPEVVSRGGRSAMTAIVGLLCVGGFLFILGALTPLPHTLERWLATAGAIAVPAAALWRLLIAWTAPAALAARCDTAVVLGAGPEAQQLIEHAQGSRGSLRRIVGCFDDRATRVPNALNGIQRMGNVDDLIDFVRNHAVDEVIVALPWTAEQRLGSLIERLKVLPVDIRLSPHGYGYRIGSGEVANIGDLPLLTAVPRPLRASDTIVKAVEDLVLGSFLMLLFLPLMTFIAVAIRLDSPGPILFRQPRHGLNDRVVHVYKFRTMYHAATDLGGGRQTRRDDDRITRVGRFLRRTSLDELPQLFNVVRGEMSLVGPRPHPINMLTEEKLCHEIVAGYAQRHKLKPGITGWAQINGWRGATDTCHQLQRRVEHDIFYVENWSLWFDFRILLMTAFKGFFGPSAF